MKPKFQLLAIILIVALSALAAVVMLRSGSTRSAAVPLGEQVDEHEHEHDGDAKKRVEISAARANAAGIVVETAGPARVQSTLRLYGRIGANEEAMTHVGARFPGVVRSVRKRLGDPVAKGDVLVAVESNISLRAYDVVSEMAGTVTRRDVTVGEFVNEQKTLFTIADLSTVWIDFPIYRDDAAKVRRGQRVRVFAEGDASAEAEAAVDFVSPLGSEGTQTRFARAVMDNRSGAFAPGLFVNGVIVLDESEAAVAVRPSAVQMLDQRPVIFVEREGGFEARVVEAGRRDADWIEIRQGLRRGERYVSRNSFLLKAELGKEGLAHDH